MSDTANTPYTNPTGPGYVGVYTARQYCAQISISTGVAVDWTQATDVVAVDLPDEPGVQLVEGPHADTITDCPVRQDGYGTIVHIKPDVLRALPEFEGGEDFRVYQRDPTGLTLVPADADPFVDGGDA